MLSFSLLLLCGCSRSHPDSAEQMDAARVGMVLLPGSTFEMGTDSSEVPGLLARFQTRREAFFAPELPRHEERVDSFWIDRAEVTNEEFARFLEANPEWAPSQIPSEFHNGEYLSHWSRGTYPESAAAHPVTYVSWYAAMAYCQWKGGRLPTEAEWEYAAGGSEGRGEFPWGDEMADTTRANYSASGIGHPTRVERYPPSEAGLYDMAGNVWEYTLDAWRDSYAEERVLAPKGPAEVKSRRVIRGGSWGGAPINLRLRFRDSHPPEGAGSHVGFRCVRPAA